jgi:hypothetical protein
MGECCYRPSTKKVFCTSKPKGNSEDPVCRMKVLPMGKITKNIAPKQMPTKIHIIKNTASSKTTFINTQPPIEIPGTFESKDESKDDLNELEDDSNTSSLCNDKKVDPFITKLEKQIDKEENNLNVEPTTELMSIENQLFFLRKEFQKLRMLIDLGNNIGKIVPLIVDGNITTKLNKYFFLSYSETVKESETYKYIIKLKSWLNNPKKPLE